MKVYHAVAKQKLAITSKKYCKLYISFNLTFPEDKIYLVSFSMSRGV